MSLLSGVVISLKSQVCFTHGLQINLRQVLCSFILFSIFHHHWSQIINRIRYEEAYYYTEWGKAASMEKHIRLLMLWETMLIFNKNVYISIIITWEFLCLNSCFTFWGTQWQEHISFSGSNSLTKSVEAQKVAWKSILSAHGYKLSAAEQLQERSKPSILRLGLFIQIKLVGVIIYSIFSLIY